MSIKKNLLYNIVYQILSIILPFITTPYISRVIGAEGIGVYSYSGSIATYFVMFAMLGLNNYGNRSIATVRNDKRKLSETFFSIYTLQLITSLIVVVLYISYVALFVKETQIIFYIQIFYLFSSVLDINWFFFGLEQFKLTVTRNIIIKTLTVISIFIFVKKPEDLWIYTFITAFGSLISQIMLWSFISKYIIYVKPNFKSVLIHLKPNIILFIPVLAISIYKVMDKIMIGQLSNMLEVAYYENSEKVINIPIGIISALGVVMLPRMTNLIAAGDKDTANQYIEISLKFVMLISIGAMAGLIAIAPTFIPMFLGNEFLECISVVSILSITLIFISWANVIRTQYLIPNNKDSIYIISTLLGAIVNVLANLILIPKYGALGAGIGTVLAELTVAVYQTIKIYGELNIMKYIKYIFLYIPPAFIMYLTVVNLKISSKFSILDVLIKVGGGGIVYLGIIFILLLFFNRNLYYKVKTKYTKIK